MSKVLYLHGLNSQLHSNRREVMQAMGLNVFAPHCDYTSNQNLLSQLLDEYDVDMVIGSSAGGLAGYYFSGLKKIPALLFNPALPFRHYIPHIPELPQRNSFLQIVIGARDLDVSPEKTFEFLKNEFNEDVPLEIHWINNLAHRFNIQIFESELRYFLHQIQ
ncbi:MAG: YqiA/YcfP family alpha/beta fold hydrolase [Flavobacteriaceae bacterium]|nr:YqiA/YcfP family alpha/beta fold hydrolase [Flavobacteriaceae bacterium]